MTEREEYKCTDSSVSTKCYKCHIKSYDKCKNGRSNENGSKIYYN